jgi:hydrogenase nickel incorporation protein HypA/HybF
VTWCKSVHELALTEELVRLAEASAEGRTVTRLSVEVGELSAVVPEALRSCFEMCREDTLLSGAVLEIIPRAGSAHCRQCEREVELRSCLEPCPLCRQYALDWLQGQDVRLLSLEVE